MKDLAREIDRTEVPAGSAALWWLGQAGFALKSSGGTRIYVDPYLSDGVERAFGFKRLSLAPVDPEAVRADWVVASHEHLDHLDLDALPIIARGNPKCRFAGPRTCFPGFERCGIPEERRTLLEPGAAEGDVRLEAARADHGDLSEAALALLFDFGGVRIFFTGDTALRLDWLRPLIERKPDVVIPCINGAFGNLNAREAAELVRAASPRLAIPCHFWMFKEHGGDPAAFAQACSELCPSVEVRFVTPGEGLMVSPKEALPIAPLAAGSRRRRPGTAGRGRRV